MTPSRWQEIERVYNRALERTPRERAAFLAEVCREDAELGREVESLLAQESLKPGAFWDRPAWDGDTGQGGADSTVTVLTPGTQLGPYRIEASIGKGGMGEVFSAVDTRLGRKVAIKTSNKQFDARFEREARAISSLNHPHICTLYDVGPSYLVMELLEGETLAERLKRGHLSIGETLRYGSQIAGALAEAHSKGIIHRDLKPANVMLTRNGVKVLDFGLAKFHMRPDEGFTVANAVMGTPAYMAPEQREGKECDARTDIFALGLVLYEMAAGTRAPQGVAPPLEHLPEKLAHVIERCLPQEPNERWQSARDVGRELEWAGRTPATIAAAPTQRERETRAFAAGLVVPGLKRPQVAWVLAALLALTMATLGLAFLRHRSAPAPQVFRTMIEPPPKTRLTNFALSPDGRYVAIAATGEHGDQIWVRALDSFQVQPLAGTDGGAFPFWSPDSRSIGFFAGEKLKRTTVDGGPVQTVCDAPNARGGTWNSEGVIVFGSLVDGLRRIDAAGGVPARLPGKRNGNSPTFLPDSRRFLYEAIGKDGGVYLGSLDAKSDTPSTLITSDISNPQYLPPSEESARGYVLFVRDETLMAKPVDPDSLAPAGDPFPVLDQVSSLPASNTYFLYSISRNGMIVHQRAPLLEHTILDRSGKQLAAIGDPVPTQGRVAVSPDERRIITELGVGRKIDLWITTFDHGPASRFTFDPSMNLAPVWSPDGNRVAFTSNRRGSFDLYVTASNQAGQDRLILRTGAQLVPTDWTRDGRFIIFQQSGKEAASGASSDLFALPVDGGKEVTLLNSEANEMEGVVSPDGRWLAYASDESGRYEVYVQRFAPGSSRVSAAKWQISPSGGRDPHWRGNGGELFYVSSDRKMMAVAVQPGREDLDRGSPLALFDVHFYTDVTLSRYAVSADGQRFVAAIPVESFSEGLMHLTVNWLAGIGK